MNIFEDHVGIVGKIDAEGMDRGLQDFFNLATEIRGKLGTKAYLLDKYISLLLAAANATLCSEAADNGFMSGSALRRICREALDGVDGEHPVFEKARAYLAVHPLQYQEKDTKTSILMAAMMGAYIKTDTATFLEDQECRLIGVIDIVQLKQLYDEIAERIGGEALMEQLNLLIRQRFFAVPLMAAYTQGLTNDLLYCLTHRDMETSRQVFQIIMDDRLSVEV